MWTQVLKKLECMLFLVWVLSKSGAQVHCTRCTPFMTNPVKTRNCFFFPTTKIVNLREKKSSGIKQCIHVFHQKPQTPQRVQMEE